MTAGSEIDHTGWSEWAGHGAALAPARLFPWWTRR